MVLELQRQEWGGGGLKYASLLWLGMYIFQNEWGKTVECFFMSVMVSGKWNLMMSLVV